MPLLDEDSNAVGCVQMENKETGSYSRNFMIIDGSTHKLRLYPEEAEFSSDLSNYDIKLEINCQYIREVNNTVKRPKVLNCLEIETTTGSFILSVDSKEERDEWIDSIRKASMRHAGRPATQRNSFKGDAGYQTKVVGGVVQRTPITASNGDKAGDGGAGAQQLADGQVAQHKPRGFPRILKAGHGIKLGAVVRNWKRRFFVLTEISLSYYKTIEELEPIRSVSVGEVTSVSAGSKEAPGKDYLFEVVTPNRTFMVQVESNEEMEAWVKIFNDLLATVRPTRQKVADGPADAQTTDIGSKDDENCISAV